MGMQVLIDYDEVYPVWIMDTDLDNPWVGSTISQAVEVSDDFIERYNRIEAEYQEMQAELKTLHQEALNGTK
jgi:hypothetical protein